MAYNSTSWTTDGSTTSVSVGNYSLYAYFGINETISQSYANNIHYAMPFQPGPPMASSVADVDIGTSTDPDTSFTTANTDTQYSGQIISMMWYVPDNITIDNIYAFVGADNATGDTTRMFLYSFTFNSASTSCLSGGTLLARNSDVTNAGNEQAYKSTFSVTTSDVDAGKVILAFFRSDSVNSDYSLNITIKYHLR